VEPRDRRISALFVHYDKPKAFGAARTPIRDDSDRFHSSPLLKRIRDVALAGLKRQISNKQSFRHLIPICEASELIGKDKGQSATGEGRSFKHFEICGLITAS